MNIHAFLDDDLRERAALFVLDALDADDARRWRLHLAGCALCRAETRSLARTAHELVHAAPTMTPSAGLFDRVLVRIRADDDAAPTAGVPLDAAHGTQIWKRWKSTRSAGPDLHFTSARENAFEPTAIDGIEVRQLSVDVDNDRVAMLVRMAPGTAYPPHRHAGAEECFVLEGELHVGDIHMKAGDFQRADQGSVHGVQRTEKGCLLFIVSSLHDELVA